MGNKKKNVTWLVVTICICVIFVPIIVFNAVLSIKSVANPSKLPDIFGIAPTAVMTGSMSPEIEEKDLIFIKQVDTDTLQAKVDVICFVKDGEFVTHRIERIEIVNGVKYFYTKGDANNAEDSGFILAEQIQGKYVGKIANLGGLILFLQEPYGILLVTILIILLYIAGELIIEWRIACKENLRLAEENKSLTEENQSLKAQLDACAQTVATQATATASSVANTQQDDDDNVADEVVVVENGLKIKYKYRRSFTSRLIQGGESLQGLYTTVKNYLLKYNGVKNRVSWGAETFSYKRNPIAKLCIRGKTLYAYLALTDEEIANLQIDESVQSVKYANVPAKIKITGVIKSNRAQKAIDVIMARLGLTVGAEITQVYSYPYETDEQLLQKGLIKLVKSDFAPPEQPTAEVAQPTDEAPQVVATTADEPIADEADLAPEEGGFNIKYKYKRSFVSRLIQSGENTQRLYTAVKNHLLEHYGVKCRNSWGCETFSYKRNPIAKLCIRGKTLYAYLALTDEEIASLQIDGKVESKKYSAVPAKIKLTGVIKLNRAQKAIDVIMARLGLVAGEKLTQSYSYPYQTDEQLLQKGLIKLAQSSFTPPAQ